MCRPGTFLNEAGVCATCLRGATCPVGSTIENLELLSGYWRYSSLATDVRECSSDEDGHSSCLGGVNVSGYCQANQSGPMCQVLWNRLHTGCHPNPAPCSHPHHTTSSRAHTCAQVCTDPRQYYKESSNSCVPCWSSPELLMGLVGVFVALVLLGLAINAATHHWLSRVRGSSPSSGWGKRLMLAANNLASLVRRSLSASERIGANSIFTELIGYCQILTSIPGVRHASTPISI